MYARKKRHKMHINNFLIDDSLPADKKIRNIFDLIIKESNKASEKTDIGKIKYYEDLVVRLGGEVCEKTEEELGENLIYIKEKTEKNKLTDRLGAKEGRRPLKRVAIALIAAVIVVFSAFGVYAAANGGYGAAWEIISSSISEIFKMAPGTQTKIDSITVIRPDHTSKYNSIEELIKEEGFDILYPTELPDGVKIEKISQSYFDSERMQIVFVFGKSHEYSFNITNTVTFPDEFLNENCVKAEFNGVVFYIMDLVENKTVQAICHYKGMEYAISASNYDDVITIISHLEKP